MKSKFLAENRGLLQLCAGAARFGGLLGLGTAGALAALAVALPMSGATGTDAGTSMRAELLTKLPTIAFYGFAALVLAEFISFLLAEEAEPKWILRHGDKIICLYILYFFAVSIQVALKTRAAEVVPGADFPRVLRSVFLIASTAVHALIWLGIGLALRKVVPIIRESKTLV